MSILSDPDTTDESYRTETRLGSSSNWEAVRCRWLMQGGLVPRSHRGPLSHRRGYDMHRVLEKQQ
jgi:hypothetical protein